MSEGGKVEVDMPIVRVWRLERVSVWMRGVSRELG